MFCAIFYLEANEGLEGAYVSHLTVTNCLWWGYLTVFIDFLTVGRGAPIYWLYGYVPLERVWFSSHLLWDRALVVIIENWSRIECYLTGLLSG